MTLFSPLEWKEEFDADAGYDEEALNARDNEFFSPPYRLVGMTAAVFFRLTYGRRDTGDATHPAEGTRAPVTGEETWPDMDTREVR